MTTHTFDRSSNLASADHDAKTGKLTIRFKNGSAWEYRDVDGDTVKELTKAESAGSFFHKSIRGRFEGSALRPVDEDDQE